MFQANNLNSLPPYFKEFMYKAQGLMPVTAIGLAFAMLGCSRIASHSAPPSAAVDKVEWTKLTCQDGAYEVSMPGIAKSKANAGYRINEVIMKDPSTGYYVHHATLPAFVESVPVENKLKRYEEQTIKKDYPGALIVKVNDLQLDEHLGKEFILVVNNRSDLIRRVYVTKDNRIFLVTVAGGSFTAASPHVKPFFDSFTIK